MYGIHTNSRRTVTAQNHHIWKWTVGLYPYMANSRRHKPPAFYVRILILATLHLVEDITLTSYLKQILLLQFADAFPFISFQLSIDISKGIVIYEFNCHFILRDMINKRQIPK